MAKRRKRKRYVHAVYVDGPHTLALCRQPTHPADMASGLRKKKFKKS
jgi:hypothetical protein